MEYNLKKLDNNESLTEDGLLKKMLSYNPNSNKVLVEKALQLAKKAHSKQRRASGEAYFVHPLAVAHILADLKLDDETIITGILHDTIEDTDITEEILKKEFNTNIATLVNGVTKFHKIQYQPLNIRQSKNFKKFLLAISKDIRILLVKICDRLHNMQTISHISSVDKQKRIATETLEIYAPLTERIGVHSIKDKLEDLSFQILYKDARKSIIERLAFLHENKDDVILTEHIIENLKKLCKNKNIDAVVLGRVKRPYSIWKKMNKENISFEQISDIMAFRIIVKDIAECYKILGVLHQKYHNVPGYFKDYISIPKENKYQSLHTILIGPSKHKIEIQIRTKEMNEIAEYGIAAHWSYKENISIITNEQNFWVNELLDVLDNSSNPEVAVASTSLDIYQDQVFCFTPKGKIIALPQGANVIDFAYAIHSDIGNHCIGTKINGIATNNIYTILENGDQVEILCFISSIPSENWENSAVTGRAKAGIRKFIREQKKIFYLDSGKNLLEECLRMYEINNIDEEKLTKNLKVFAKNTLDDLYISLGEKILEPYSIFKVCYPEKIKRFNKKEKLIRIFSKKKNKQENKITNKNDLIKESLPGVNITLPICCYPVVNDKIVIERKSLTEMVIHRNICKKINIKDNNISKAYWRQNVNYIFECKFNLILINKIGVFARVLQIIANNNINVITISDWKKHEKYHNYFSVSIEVPDLKTIKKTKASLRILRDVIMIERV